MTFSRFPPGNLRNTAKEVLARFHGLLGRNRLSVLQARHPLLVLCYHRVIAERGLGQAPFPGLCVGESAFARQVAYLADHFEVVTLSEAVARLPLLSNGSRPLAVITLDDGYVDNYRVAFPVLRRLGVPATVFLVADHVGTSEPLWFDAFALQVFQAEREGRLKRLADGLLGQAAARAVARPLHLRGSLHHRAHAAVTAMKALPERERAVLVEAVFTLMGDLDAGTVERIRLMNWDEVREMAAGGIEFGSHTATHPILPGLPSDRLDREVSASKWTLETEIGGPVTAFCYPNGDHDEAVVHAVQAAGYTCAVTTLAATNLANTSPFLLNRESVGPRTGIGFGGRVSGAVFTAELLHLF